MGFVNEEQDSLRIQQCMYIRGTKYIDKTKGKTRLSNCQNQLALLLSIFQSSQHTLQWNKTKLRLIDTQKTQHQSKLRRKYDRRCICSKQCQLEYQRGMFQDFLSPFKNSGAGYRPASLGYLPHCPMFLTGGKSQPISNIFCYLKPFLLSLVLPPCTILEDLSPSPR